MTISPPIDARSFLGEPSTAGPGMTVDQMRSQAGVYASTIDSVIQELSGFSILEEWIARPFGGDWKQLSQAANSWEQAGKAVGAVADNMLALPRQIGTQWTGEAAMAFAASQAKVAGSLAVFKPLSAGMKQWCVALIELGNYIVKMVLASIKELSYKTSGMLAAAATVIGALSVPAWVASIAQSIMSWTKRIKEAIDLFRKFVEQVKEIVDAVRRAIGVIQVMLATAQAAVAKAGGGNSAFGRGLGGLQDVASGAGSVTEGAQRSNDTLLAGLDTAAEANRRTNAAVGGGR